MAATFIEPPPQHTSAPSSKETRVGAPAQPNASTAGAGAKETRIGPAPHAPQAFAPQQQGFAPQQKGFAQQQQQYAAPQNKSFMSSLTWVHFAGAGVAALVVLGVVIGLGVFALSGSNKGKEPVKPASLAEEPSKPAAPPVEQPSQAETQTTQPAGGSGTNAADAQVPGASPAGTTVIPIEQPPPAGGTVATSGSTQGSSRPAQKAPAQAKPKPADSGEAARKRREAALRALDQ